MTTSKSCQKCGVPLPEGVLQGLCGRCLAQLALGEESVAAPASTSPADPPAETGRYEVQAKIAQGGMGEVLEARDLHFGRSVAMKVIRGERDPSHEMRLRFVQEARILSLLEHPNIVPVHDLDKDEHGRVFYTMKKVQGVTLKEVINRLKTGDAETVKEFSLSQLLTIFQKVCDAVGFAHSKGVVHRDLKPENVMVGEFGEVLVMDWGLAKVLAHGNPSDGRSRGDEAHSCAEAEARSDREKLEPHVGSYTGEEGFQEMDDLRPPSGEGGYDLTLEGTVMGTPQFMAPEQAEGRIADIDERTDIFSLGGILYSLLTLRPPTGGTTVREVLANIKTGYIPPPIFYNKARRLAADGTELEMAIALAHCPGNRIPDSLSAVCMKAMAVEAAERYQTVPELQAEIAAYQGGFATGAERAGAFRQLWLLVLRHKAVVGLTAAGLMMMGAMATFLISKIVQFQHKADVVLTDLKKTVPLKRAELLKVIDAQDFSDALSKCEELIALQPDSVEFHLVRANLLQTMLRLADARDAYQKVLKLAPENSLARSNVVLCSDLLADSANGNAPSAAGLERLATEQRIQGRLVEALATTKRVGKVTGDLLTYWQGVLDKAGIQGKLEYDQGGLLDLDLSKQNVADLTPLKGMPLSRLNLGDNTQVTDLNPLRGMPLKDFYIQDCRVNDLSSLKGMPLEKLFYNAGLEQSKYCRDFSPLSGMPLKSVTIYNASLDDLKVFRGAPLTELQLFNCFHGDDLSPLRGLPLTTLRVYAPNLSDLSPLKGMRLENLGVTYSRVMDISVVKDMPLTTLALEKTLVRDIGALKGMRVYDLNLADCVNLIDLSSLRGMAVHILRLEGCKNLQDLSPLVECKDLTWLSIPLEAKNIEVLRNLPNLKKLTYALSGGDWGKVPPVSEFWKAYDAKKGIGRGGGTKGR